MKKESIESYQLAHSALSALIRKADPIGLIAGGAPADEYDPEVSAILARRREAGSLEDIQRIAHEVFVEWFGPDTAGPATYYSALAKGIWAWRRQGSASTQH